MIHAGLYEKMYNVYRFRQLDIQIPFTTTIFNQTQNLMFYSVLPNDSVVNLEAIS